jgi:ABC-type sugar transport system ATPase subunit
MPTIRTQAISKTFPDGTVALRTINLEVNDGELMVLVGPSGCGKTTLLRIISGLETPSEGELFFDEQKITQLPPDKRDLGMVFQNYAPLPTSDCFQKYIAGSGNK